MAKKYANIMVINDKIQCKGKILLIAISYSHIEEKICVSFYLYIN